MLLKFPPVSVAPQKKVHRNAASFMKLASSLIILASIASFTPVAVAGSDDADLGFESAFPRKLHQKKYFASAITGATVVAAGALTYFTAGAGAPAAATGVSTVASWVGGGGAGSYMAGLSTIGGWFGGNAMLGSAILNGVSLGTVGGMSSWGALSAGEKALALSATAATAMDGVAILSKPGTTQLEFRFILPVPLGLADARIRTLLENLSEAGHEVDKRGRAVNVEKTKQAPGAPPTASTLEAEQELSAAKGRFNTVTGQVDEEFSRVLKLGSSNRTTVVMAVLANNGGRTSDFRTLLKRIKPDSLTHRAYLDYLRAIAALQTNKMDKAERLLYGSLRAANYAIEPPNLLVEILGRRGNPGQESRIDEIAGYADRHFDADAYMPVASLVSLHYRIGNLALRANRCERALYEFKKAQSELSTIEKYWKGKGVRNHLDLGVANALHCQNQKDEAHKVFEKVWHRLQDDDARELLCVQYRGGCAR